MKRVFYPYYLWEDYLNGMYNTKVNNFDFLKNKSIELLSCSNLFYEYAVQMIHEWEICTIVNLTNLEQNRKAWLGQASCCFYARVPEFITCIAWMQLTEQQRKNANNVAKNIIENYERKLNNTKQIILEL